MNLFFRLKMKFAIYCPKCKSELYWDGSWSKDGSDSLYCKDCNDYYKYFINNKKITLYNEHKEFIKNHPNYEISKNKTSDFYAPGFIKFFASKYKNK